MSNPNNTIVLNGRLYDAQTGTLFNGSMSTPKSPHRAKKIKKSGQALDGFMMHPKHHPAVLQAKKLAKPLHIKHRSEPAKHAAAHHPQHARTLMRSIVKRPDKTPNTSVADEDRQKRASSVNKSHLISRFGSGHSVDSVVVKRSASLSVKTPPKATRKTVLVIKL